MPKPKQNLSDSEILERVYKETDSDGYGLYVNPRDFLGFDKKEAQRTDATHIKFFKAHGKVAQPKELQRRLLEDFGDTDAPTFNENDGHTASAPSLK